MTLTWPDIVIGAVFLFFILKGWKRGLVSELAGAVALFAAIVAAVRYPGTLDDLVRTYLHAGPGTAHLAGMIVFALAVYLAITALAWIVGRFAKLPVISLGNSAAGALVGLVKAFIGSWAVLYIALFFPLSPAIRADLHDSTLVSIVTTPNDEADAVMRNALPPFMKSLTEPLFTTHRV